MTEMAFLHQHFAEQYVRIGGAVYSLKRIFAFFAYLFGTVASLYAIVVTQLPWYPRSNFEAIMIPGAMFAVGGAALGLSWFLMRRGRREIVVDDPLRWRWTEWVLLLQGGVGGFLFVLLVASTVSR
jgi:hypothetical protein